MLRRPLRVSRACGAAICALIAVIAASSLIVSGQSGAANGEWRHWGADLGNTKYSSLDQINRDNVKNLRVAWRWKADNFGPRPQNNLEATPLMIGGVLFTTAGTRPSVAAIDGATGETLWIYRLDEGAPVSACRCRPSIPTTVCRFLRWSPPTGNKTRRAVSVPPARPVINLRVISKPRRTQRAQRNHVSSLRSLCPLWLAAPGP